MTAPKPVVLTQRAAVSGEPAPQPLDIVGGLPAAALPAPAASTRGGVQAGSDALLTTGTDTALRGWSAKQIADYVAAQIQAALE